MSSQTWLWIGFAAFVIIMMSLDLGVFNRRPHEIKFKEALAWSIVWFLLAIIFNVGVYIWRGHQPAIEFATAYLIEESLSVDNLFVFLLIFTYFKVPSHYQHSVLFWGIIGVMVLRGIFIALGIALLNRFEWIIYIFGGMLIITAIKLALEKDKEIEFEKNIVLKLFRRFVPISQTYEGAAYWVRKNGRLMATPLLVILVLVDITDVIFAVDSIPAVLAISKDPFIVYTSNTFAILGLRSLYFVLAHIMGLFHHLHYGLAVILAFIGIKMLLTDIYHIPTGISLLFTLVTLTFSIVASLIWPAKEKHAAVQT